MSKEMITKLKKHIENQDIVIQKDDYGLLFEFALFPANFPWEPLQGGDKV